MGTHSRGFGRRTRLATALALAGLVGLGVAGTAQAGAPVVEGTPCTAAARACVDLNAKLAWLIQDGGVVRGPLPISIGGPDRETPRGDFRVEWKNKNHRSAEFDGAPMPFAVFFAQGGIAFHEGNLHTNSAGCVRMVYDDAAAFYDFLRIDDRVEVR